MKLALTKTANVFKGKSICPYFEDGRISFTEYLMPGQKEMGDFHKYLAKGYRRLGKVFYRNICENCADCKPLRIETAVFHPSRGQTRTLKKNIDVRVEILSQPEVTRGKIELYAKYVRIKHNERRSSDFDHASAVYSIHYGYPGTLEMNYYLNDKLIGVGIVDEGENALSSNYFYYDTEYLNRRPGVFSLLKEIQLARDMGKKYFYHGFYIEKNHSMSYKKHYRPNQILEKGIWRNFSK